MKKNTFYIFISLIIIFTSCSEDKTPFRADLIPCSDGIKNGDERGIDCGGSCPDFCSIPNSLEGDLYIRTALKPSEEYTITGPLIIRDGGSLEIPAGMTVKVAPNRNAYIVVTQGGKFYAFGNAENPVNITSAADSPQPGDWGGILFCGKAPINSGTIGRSEVGDIFYGGNEPDDSSGVIKFLTVEYTGATFRESYLFSGLSFFGVGSKTTVNNVQSLHSLGDGIKFYGGNVSASNIVVTNSSENGIAITEGWYGTLQKGYLSGIEKSGISIYQNSSVNGSLIEDFSILGDSSNQALNYGEGKGIVNFQNIFTSNFNIGIRIFGEEAAQGIEANEFTVSTIQFDNKPSNFMATDYTGANQSFFNESNTIGAGNSASIPNWAIDWVKGY